MKLRSIRGVTKASRGACRRLERPERHAHVTQAVLYGVVALGEHTFAWLGRNRRMSKDYKRLCETGEALVLVTMTRLMASRLARV